VAVTGIATSFMFGIAQIVHGDATCSACDRPAVVTTWNGADPDAEPMCLDHALMMLDMTRSVAVNIFGAKNDDE
jgi:hypothetical protein